MEHYKAGDIIPVVVSGFTDYGVFIQTDDGYTGLIHISEISKKFVRNPKFFVDMNEVIYAKVLEVDDKIKHLKLSIKNNQYRKNGTRQKKIIETKHGFNTLAYKLPYWIEENIKIYNDKKI